MNILLKVLLFYCLPIIIVYTYLTNKMPRWMQLVIKWTLIVVVGSVYLVSMLGPAAVGAYLYFTTKESKYFLLGLFWLGVMVLLLFKKPRFRWVTTYKMDKNHEERKRKQREYQMRRRQERLRERLAGVSEKTQEIL
jgi:hypothetical protein